MLAKKPAAVTTGVSTQFRDYVTTVHLNRHAVKNIFLVSAIILSEH